MVEYIFFHTYIHSANFWGKTLEFLISIKQKKKQKICRTVQSRVLNIGLPYSSIEMDGLTAIHLAFSQEGKIVLLFAKQKKKNQTQKN